MFEKMNQLPSQVQSEIFSKLKFNRNDLLLCRRVCRDWKGQVDKLIGQWTFPGDEVTSIASEGIRQSLIRDYTISFDDAYMVQGFMDRIKKYSPNPFPSRWVDFSNMIHGGDMPWKWDSIEALDNALPAFANKFGDKIWGIKYPIEDYCTASHVGLTLLPNFYNLRTLEITMARFLGSDSDTTDSDSDFVATDREDNEDSEFDTGAEKILSWNDIIKKHKCFPRLTQLTKISLSGDSAHFIGKALLMSYGPQLRSLCAQNSELFKFLLESMSSDAVSSLIPNLINIELDLDFHSFKILKHATWNLKRLRVHVVKSEFPIQRFVQVINKFAGTLEVLYFPKLLNDPDSSSSEDDVSNLESILENNNGIEKALDMNINFLVLRELSISYELLANPVIIKLLQKFTNLKNIYAFETRARKKTRYQKEISMWWPKLNPKCPLKVICIYNYGDYEWDFIVHHKLHRPN